MESMIQDIRYAVRSLLRNKIFAGVATATLALGIGANTAIFSVVNGVLLESLPYDDPEGIVRVWGTDEDGRFGVSEQELVRYRQADGIFDAFGAYVTGSVNLLAPDGAERIGAAGVIADRLPLLGIMPALGRNFTPQEDAPGRDGVALLAHELWRGRYAGDPGVLGETIVLDGEPVTVVGVLPEGFRLPTQFTGPGARVLLPLALPPTPDPRNIHYLTAFGRLRSGLGVEGANAELVALSADLLEAFPSLPPGFRARAVPVREVVVGHVRPVLLLLLGAVGLVLLIASVNVANLLLARAEGRGREMVLRAALGADRGRLVRQLFTESAVLGVLGGAVGLILAVWGTQALLSRAPANIPRVEAIEVDVRVLGFTLAISLLAGLLFGLFPALRAASGDVTERLRGEDRGSTGHRGGSRVRKGLVLAEMALTVMLAIGAGLLVRSYLRLQAVDPGFRVEDFLTLQVEPPQANYAEAPSVRTFYQDLFRRVRSLPGVEEVGAVTHLPLSDDPGDWGIRIEGREEEVLASGRRPWADWMVTTRGYHQAMGIPLAEGRFFEASDVAEARPVVLINETAARRYWPDGSAVGRRFRMSSDIDPVYRTVVGVVRDIRHGGLDAELRPEIHLPHSQFPAGGGFAVRSMTLTLRTRGDPLAVAGATRGAVRNLDPEVPISRVRTMERVVRDSTSVRRLQLVLFVCFGALALLLATVGVYGVMAYLVARRTRELGIRMTLGATAPEVMRLVVGQGMGVALVGIGLGVIGAVALSRIMERFLFGVSTIDPLTFVGVPALLAAVALVACWSPVRRALALDPVAALRQD